MPVELTFRNILYLTTTVLCFITVAQGAGTIVPTITAPQSLASSISFGVLSQPSQPPAPVSSSNPVQSAVTTLITISTSTTTVTSTILPSPTQSFGWEPEHGPEYGKVVIRNHCNETLYLESVGAYRLNGPTDDSKGWGTKEEEIVHVLAPSGNYSEPFRMTCPIPKNHTGPPVYCPSQDKLQGQGVSLKIAKSNTSFQEIMQFEYALVQNPERNDTFKRIDYDVSLLDCANPVFHPQAFTAQVAGVSRNVTKITDYDATVADHAAKVEMCPGYRNGVSVTFPNDPHQVCPPIKCDGSALCFSIYNFDRTREDEASMACHQEFRGEMVLDLCAGRMNATVKAL